MNIPLMRDPAPVLILGEAINRKRGEHRLQERVALLQLLEALARAANEAASAEEAMRNCLRLICRHGNWAIGRLAIYSEKGDESVFPDRSFWEVDDPSRYDEFIRASLDSRFYLATGRFISPILRERRPVWFSPVTSRTPTGRMAAAIRQGLRCAFGFPVVARDRIVAVLEFFAREARPPDALLLENITNVGAQLARLVERERAEALNARLAAIVEQSNDAIISRTLDRKILTWNPAAERLFGYSATEAIGRDISIIIPPECRTEVARNIELIEREEKLPTYDTVRMSKDGRRIPVSLTHSPVRSQRGEITSVAVIFRDITERRQAEEKQRANEARVHELLRRLDEIQETERYRIAADLHDVVGQRLSTLAIQVEMLRATIGEDRGARVDAALGTMAQTVQETTDSLREAIAELRPALLDDCGVVVAIENYASRMERLTGLRIHVRGYRTQRRLPRKTELALFRIAQEALINAAKHACATEVTLVLAQSDDMVSLSIADNGRGIERALAAAQSRNGWGMGIMAERAAALGGHVTVDSPGKGTRVLAEIPVGNSHHSG